MTDFVEVTSFDPLIMKAPKGDKGDPGPANSLTIGTVTQGTAAATITGTAPNQVLNLVLQKGEKGDKGDPGTGDVSTVNGIQPDAAGNVQLTADDVGAASTTDLASKADLVGGVVPTSQIPAIALETRVAVADQAAMLALTSSQVQPGDVASRGDGAGTFMLMADDPSVLSNWALLNAPADAVSSVNGQTGTVVLGASDVSAVPTARTVNSKPLSADVVLAASDVGAATSAQGALADSAVQPGDLATVATTGAYGDLSGKPTLGTAAAAATTDFAASTKGGAEKTAAGSATTGTVTLDCSTASVFTISPTGDITLAPSNVPASGTACTITVIISMPFTVRTVTMPSGTIWLVSEPSYSAGSITVLTMLTVNGGAGWICTAGTQT